MKAELVPNNGDPPIPITRDVTVVGRRDYCDIVIDHPSLSKRHCVLVRTDGLVIIRDLATTNGTKINGQRVSWAALLPNDRVSLGNYKMRIYLGPDDAPAPSELPARSVPLGQAAREPARAVAAAQAGTLPAPLGFAPPSPSDSPVPRPPSDEEDLGEFIVLDDNVVMDAEEDEEIIELD